MRLARFERRLIKMHMRWAEHSWPLKPKRRRLKKMPKTTLFNTAPNALAVGFYLATIRLDDWPPKNGQRKNAQLSSNQCPDSYSRPCPESWWTEVGAMRVVRPKQTQKVSLSISKSYCTKYCSIPRPVLTVRPISLSIQKMQGMWTSQQLIGQNQLRPMSHKSQSLTLH